MEIKRYIIQFKDKETNKIKYFLLRGNDEYVIIDKIKYKKRTYHLTEDKDAAFYRQTLESAQSFIEKEIIAYRADLEDKYEITAIESEYPTNKLKPVELTDTFFDFIFHLKNWLNEHKGYEDKTMLAMLKKNGNHIVELGDRLDYDDVYNLLNHLEDFNYE